MALMTDEYGAYRGLGKEFASHETVTHKAGEYVRGHVYTNTAESFNGRGWVNRCVNVSGGILPLLG